MKVELREKIAKLLYTYENQYDNLHNEDSFMRGLYLGKADRILALIKEAGYVKLAENQELPPIAQLATFNSAVKAFCAGTQQNMLKAGFRKVEL